MTAKRGSEALYIAQEKEDDIHVVLTGVHLPDMNKYELLEKMRTVSNLPVVSKLLLSKTTTIIVSGFDTTSN